MDSGFPGWCRLVMMGPGMGWYPSGKGWRLLLKPMGGAMPDIGPPCGVIDATARDAALADSEFADAGVRSVGDGRGCVFWLDWKVGKLAC
jgi:hypothetical protein